MRVVAHNNSQSRIYFSNVQAKRKHLSNFLCESRFDVTKVRETQLVAPNEKQIVQKLCKRQTSQSKQRTQNKL